MNDHEVIKEESIVEPITTGYQTRLTASHWLYISYWSLVRYFHLSILLLISCRINLIDKEQTSFTKECFLRFVLVSKICWSLRLFNLSISYYPYHDSFYWYCDSCIHMQEYIHMFVLHPLRYKFPCLCLTRILYLAYYFCLWLDISYYARKCNFYNRFRWFLLNHWMRSKIITPFDLKILLTFCSHDDLCSYISLYVQWWKWSTKRILKTP